MPALGLNASVEWMPWLRTTFDAGLGGCFDVLSAHSYTGPSALDKARGIAAEKGGRTWTST